MKLITMREYNHITMQLARPILDKHKRVLLGVGKTIHPKYKEKLEELDIKYLFIEDKESWGVNLDEMADMPSWLEAIEEVKTVFDNANASGSMDVRRLSIVVSKLEDEVKKRKVMIPIPATAVPVPHRYYAHVINVTILALMLAKSRNLNGMQIHELAMGCILHDIGKKFTNIEEDHPKEGFDFLRKIREISIVSAHVAYQHHERFDGEGYPRKLKDKEIHDLAQICAIANLYENLISLQEVPPHEALEIIMTKSANAFSQELVQTFVNTIPTYYPGTRVELSNKREGIITRLTSHLHRPFIRYFDTNEEISLASNPTLIISKILPNN